MDIVGRGKRLSIYIGEADKWHGQPLAQALIERLRAEGIAGATVTRGILGYGANSRIHSAQILRLSEDLPLIIEVVDRQDHIERILPLVDEMVGEGLVVLDDVEVVHYRHSSEHSPGSL
jgi:PII-like signaling protein